VGEEPSALIGDLKRAVELVGAHALLATAHQVHGLKPDMQGKFGLFKDRTHANCELLFAIATLFQAHTDALFHVGLNYANSARAAAMRANWTLRPKNAFDFSEGGGFIVKMRRGEDRHGFDSLEILMPSPR